MKRFGPLIISLFVAVTAWAGDVGYTVPEEIGYGSLVLYEVAQPVSEIWLNQDTRELVFRDADGKEIVLNDILQRCLEFVKDAEYDDMRLVLYDDSYPDTRTEIEKARDGLEQAKERLRVAEGREAYYKDKAELISRIKKAIKILKGESK